MFAIPLLLFGLAAAAIPLLIHLLHRNKTTPLDWGAMLFLQAGTVRQKRSRRLDHWLLMLLRILLLALLALLLAEPILPAGKFNPLVGNASSDVVVVLDHSLASGFQSGGETVFQRGVDLVERIAGHLRPGDTLAVVLAQHRPQALTPLSIPAKHLATIQERLIRPLRQMASGLTDSSIPAALAYARRYAQRGDNFQKIIFVISNHRAGAWRINQPALWRAMLPPASEEASPPPIFDLPTPIRGELSDIAVGPLHIQPAVPGVGRQTRLLAAVSNSGPLAVSSIPLRLIVDGTPLGAKMIAHLEPGQTQNVVFHYRFSTAGSHWVKLQADVQDALAADNWSLAAVRVWGSLPVLIIDSALANPTGFQNPLHASRFLQAALNPLPTTENQRGLVEPKVVSVSDAGGADLEAYDAVIVNDPPQLPEDLLRNLYTYARAGHGVWFILGRSTTPRFIRQLDATGFPVGKTAAEAGAATHPPLLVIRSPHNPIFRPLAQLKQNAILNVTLRHWWRLGLADPQTRILLTTNGGDPLVLERPIGDLGGAMVLWTTSVDGRWNDWPLQGGSFVPVVNQTVEALALGQKQLERHYLHPSDTLVWTGPTQPPIVSASLIDPLGVVHKIQPRLTVNNRYLVAWNHTARPGLYELKFVPDSIPQPVYYGVGIDPAELNAQTLSGAQVAWLTHHGYIKARIKPAGITAALGVISRGVNLWPLLAGLVLLMLVLETFWCRRMIYWRSDVDAEQLAAGATGTRT